MTDHYIHEPALQEQIRYRLTAFDRQSHVDANLRGAAVALTISKHSNNDEASLLLTLRSSSLRKHAGQFALPGGKIDEGETLEQAALRELSEELGLNLKEEHILGKLDDFATRSGFVISPVVVWNDTDDALQPNPDEVARVFEIPLSQLALPDFATITTKSNATTGGANKDRSIINTDVENRKFGPDASEQDQPFLTISPAAVNTTVYSPTAAIIYQFREVALFGRETRVAHFEQPAFAWK